MGNRNLRIVWIQTAPKRITKGPKEKQGWKSQRISCKLPCQDKTKASKAKKKHQHHRGHNIQDRSRMLWTNWNRWHIRRFNRYLVIYRGLNHSIRYENSGTEIGHPSHRECHRYYWQESVDNSIPTGVTYVDDHDHRVWAPVCLRKVSFLVVGQDMTWPVIGRPLLRALGLDLDDHLHQ